MADAREKEVWDIHSLQMMSDNAHICGPITESIKLLFPDSQIDILDYGCGTAQWAPTFKEFNYYCYDQNEMMIAGAAARLTNLGQAPKAIYCSTWDKLSIDKTFDIVYTSAVLQHNLHVQKDIVVKQIVSLIKPSGYYIGLENTLEPVKNAFQFPVDYKFTDDTTDGYSFTRVGWLKYFGKFGLVDKSDLCMKFWGVHKSDYYVLQRA